jgi:hypothetical protein|tara:strand:+ start:4432 stop:5100 length:669 start_codon:yes stop_codon:yes gene_type:complete
MIQLRAGYLIALAIGGLSFACLGDDVRYWSSVTTQAVELNENWKTASFAQIRSPELEFLQYGRFSQKFLRAMGEKWTFGAHPAIEYKRSSGGDPWVNNYRLEVEAVGKFKLSGGPALSTRSRWEFRLKDGKGSETFHRIRQQIKATWQLESLGPVESYTFWDELFYELDQSQIVANRFVPLSIGLKSTGTLRKSAWLMYFSQRSKATERWTGSYVMGMDFKF